MRLVCVVGIDGAGKSTVARLVVARLQAMGQPAVYRYGRTYPVLSRLLMHLGRKTRLRKQDPWRDYPAYAEDKRRAMRSPVLASVYAAAVLLDYYAGIWLKLLPVALTRRTVVTVVMDRYVHDTLVNELAAQLDFGEHQLTSALRVMSALLPSPAAAYLIDLPPEVALSRKDDVPHVDYLRTRRAYYLTLAATGSLEVLDGELPPDALADVVVRRVTSIAGDAEVAAR